MDMLAYWPYAYLLEVSRGSRRDSIDSLHESRGQLFKMHIQFRYCHVNMDAPIECPV